MNTSLKILLDLYIVTNIVIFTYRYCIGNFDETASVTLKYITMIGLLEIISFIRCTTSDKLAKIRMFIHTYSTGLVLSGLVVCGWNIYSFSWVSHILSYPIYCLFIWIIRCVIIGIIIRYTRTVTPHGTSISNLLYTSCPMCRTPTTFQKLYINSSYITKDCDICLEKLENPYITKCGHLICANCTHELPN